MKTEISISVLIIIFLFLGITILFWVFQNSVGVSAGEREKQKCFEYERDNVIPKGSCQCAINYYKDFSHSYDWMDACKYKKYKE